MKKLLIIFLILFSYSTVNAEITDKDERFSLLCEAEQSVGYRWKNHDWEKVNWILPRYIITKQDYAPLDIRLPHPEHFLCSGDRQGSEKMLSRIYMDSCYKIKELGDEVDDFSYRTCREEWDANTNALIKVSCEFNNVRFHSSAILFKPNGWFTEYRIAAQVANLPKALMSGETVISPAGAKDDMFIYVGKCSTL